MQVHEEGTGPVALPRLLGVTVKQNSNDLGPEAAQCPSAGWTTTEPRISPANGDARDNANAGARSTLAAVG